MLTHPPKPSKSKERSDGKKAISIAMQGGGAHGAFTWGVLDRLLEDGRIVIEGMTGTSAGGMNAIATAQGLIEGGNEGARHLLRKFWKRMSEVGANSPLKPGLIDKLQNKFTMYNSPGFVMFDFLTKLMSPYQMNPLNHDPLRDVIVECFDFEKIRKNKDIKVYLAATHVYSGKLKVFGNKDLKVEALQATACLPTIHPAVMVDGEYYWDGGFIGNPVIYPLIYDCETPDILVLKLNPTHRNKLPTTAVEIGDRLNEITNNTSILREMRAINFITKLIDDGLVDESKIKRLNMHLIQDESTFQDLGWSSKLNTEWEFFEHLFEAGRACASKWLEENFKYVGKKSSMPMDDLFIS